jgi:hypothetical protein
MYLNMTQLSLVIMKFGAGGFGDETLHPPVSANLLNFHIIQMCFPSTTADGVNL